MNPTLILQFLSERTLWISIAILFLLLIRPLMKRLPRSGLYLLWVILVLRILCPVNIEGIYHLLPSTQNTASSLQETISYGGMANRYRLSPEQKECLTPEKEPAANQLLAAANEFSQKKSNTDSPSGESSSSMQPAILSYGLFFLWLAGLLFCIGHLLFSLHRDRKTLRDAVCLRRNIYEHPDLETSFVSGFLRPHIYLPAGISETDQTYLLAHEQFHVRRQDFRMKPIAFLAFALLWFNPLSWIAWHLMQKDMEISCDESVIRHLNLEERKYYSHLLLNMAAGQKRILTTNTAFGADIIQERIVHVMKYKNPTGLLVAVTLVITLLCACSIGSTPAEPTQEPKKEASDGSENAVYVEQNMKPPVSEEENYLYNYTRLIVNQQGKPVWFGQKYNKKTMKLLSYVKAELTEDGWDIRDTSWSEAMKKKLQNGFGYVADAWYAKNGALYAVITQTSMDSTQYKMDTEKYNGQYVEFDQQLFRIEESEGTMKEITVPGRRPEESRAGSPNHYIPLSNGNYIVSNLATDGGDCLLYSGVTDEVIGTPKKGIGKGIISPISSGNDFLCYAIYNNKKNVIQIQTCDYDGENSYTLDYEIPVTEEDTELDSSYALGAWEDEIVLVDKKGIYRAQYGDEKFTRITDFKNDNIYYLTLDGYQLYDYSLRMAGEDDFYAMLRYYNEYGENDYKFCHYTKKN